MGVLIGNDVKELLIRDSEVMLSQVTISIKGQLESDLNALDRDLTRWSTLPSLTKALDIDDKEHILPGLLSDLCRHRPLIRSLAVISAEKTVLASFGNTPIAPSSLRFNEILKNQTHLLEYSPVSGSTEVRILLSTRVQSNRSSASSGWLVLLLNASTVNHYLKKFVRIGGDTDLSGLRLLLVGTQQQVLLGTDPDNLGRTQLDKEIQAVSLARKGEVGVGRNMTGLGSMGMLAYAPVNFGAHRWVVLAFRDRLDVLAPVQRLTRKLLWIGLIAWFVALGVGGFVLQRIASPLRRYVDLVAEEAGRIAIASQEQSVSTTQQANSIRETTATVRELKASMDQTQEVASTVLSTTEASIRATAEGIEASSGARDAMNQLTIRVNDVTKTISALSREMGRIAEILSVVNDLAEQSKFLALNAAIEAARAGEHGKGFGVVSVEVRNLAQQSQEATSQIRLIIEETTQAMGIALQTAKDGQEEARRGQQVVDRTKQVIDSLSEVIKDAKLSSDQILASINQQSLGIDQIASAIDQIDEGVTQTVTAAEHTATISMSLQDASEHLGAFVGGKQKK
jgi:hypothetical protein